MGSINTGNSAIYDLSEAPITFDFVNFLAFARLAVALKSKDPSFFLTIIADSWRNSTWREHQYDVNDRLWRLHNLIIPVCSVTPGVVGYSVFLDSQGRGDNTGTGVTVTSEGGTYLMKALFEIFKISGFNPHLFAAPEMALDYAARIFGHEKNAVLISIRESSFDSGRNTPARFLQDLILQLQGAGLAVYLIPDQEVTHNTDQLPSGVTIIEEAAYNIPLRLALHELARVSICSGSGPTNFISLSVRKPSLVVIHPMRPEIHISSPDYLSQQGYTIGSPQPLPWIPSNQVWLWDPLVTVKEVCATAQTLMSSRN